MLDRERYNRAERQIDDAGDVTSDKIRMIVILTPVIRSKEGTLHPAAHAGYFARDIMDAEVAIF